MLRKRSRAVTSTQAIVGENSNTPWLSPEKSTKPTSFFFNSPKFFKGLFTNYSSSTLNEQKPMMSPTSILETKAFCAFANTFWVFDNKKKNPKTFSSSSSSSSKHSWEQPNNPKGIGLALIDETNITEPNNTTSTPLTTKQQKTKLVVFGSQLKIQVPPLPQSSAFPCFSPREFGIKTPRNNLWPFGNKDSQVHPQEFSPVENGLIISEKGNQNLSLSDMELSEDYTCVIHNGPNPKTTHIFGNCIVQSCCGVVGSSSFSAKRNGDLSNFGNSIPLHQDFLSYCHHCKKKLGEGSDIYMYRGEKAFCSPECRCQEMLLDDVEN